MDASPTVFILDDDKSFLSAVGRLLQAEGFTTRSWSSASKFLADHDPEEPGCLLTDLLMPEMSGLELQSALLASGCVRPIVFVTARGDMPTTVAGMRAGAISFLPKPVRRSELTAALREAIMKDAAIRAERAERLRIQDLRSTLTPRERQVLELVAQGLRNKQIAGTLGAAVKTIKIHRGRVMRKMRVNSVAEVVQLLTHDRESAVEAATHPALVSSEVRVWPPTYQVSNTGSDSSRH